ncbi:MAG TPA: hypothetical protein VGI03_14010 [Verrucomicrobiae bacterium]|jgi:hypothetical protein
MPKTQHFFAFQTGHIGEANVTGNIPNRQGKMLNPPTAPSDKHPMFGFDIISY